MTEILYDVIVIDPPWPVQLIHKKIRPLAANLPYRTMSLQEIQAMDIPASSNCHLWLWTTHKFLPPAFETVKKWGFRYTCTFVWHKNVGYQIWNLPTWNCEFILYARKGNPRFIETKNFKVCFFAKNKRHSQKPEEFYHMVRRITTGKRLDMFSRRHIEGFDLWGDQAPSKEVLSSSIERFFSDNTTTAKGDG